MKLPIFKSISKLLEINGEFKGIGDNSLADSINLLYSDHCHTRKGREATLLLRAAPDQIINCENRLFLRYGNILREMLIDTKGYLIEYWEDYVLKSLTPAPDRSIVSFDGKLFVLPDKLQIGVDLWAPFAENFPISAALPFENARTLFYPEDVEAEGFCGDALKLKVGTKLRFSWIADTEFTVNTIEDYTVLTDDESGFSKVGKRITLNKDVTQYSSPPTNGRIEYCDPQNRPIITPLTVGYNHRISFLGNKITITSNTSAEFPLSEFFKVGQTVDISGSSISSNNTIAKIVEINGNSLLLDHFFTAVEEAEKREITINPVIPDFNHVLITADRLFGVDNTKGKLYVSALKNPFLFCDGETKSEDSWSVNINGTVTGMALWKDSVICFTENGGFRIIGYNANNFRLRHIPVSGIKKGCEKSLCRVGDTLYYCSNRGVMRYSGENDVNVFRPFLQISNVKTAITDGKLIYMLDGDRIWIYDTNTKICCSEDCENISRIFIFKSKRCLLSDKIIYLADIDTTNKINWNFELHNLPDDKVKKTQGIHFIINYSGDTDCSFALYYKPFGETAWKSCGTYSIKGEGRVKIPLPKNYCNGFKIKAEGNGFFEPKSWSIVYRK